MTQNRCFFGALIIFAMITGLLHYGGPLFLRLIRLITSTSLNLPPQCGQRSLSGLLGCLPVSSSAEWSVNRASKALVAFRRSLIFRSIFRFGGSRCRNTWSYGWVPVVRYDTAHGFAHCDKLHPYEAATKIKMATCDYNDALTTAMDDLMNNWHTYRRRYARWLKER